MDKSCPLILNIGPHRIIEFKHVPGYYTPHIVLDNVDFYMCSKTALECDSIDYSRCRVYINYKERMFERTAKKKFRDK